MSNECTRCHRLTQRVAELEGENERLEKQVAEYYGAGCDALDKAISHEQRADQLQAKLDAVMVMFVYKKGDRYYTGIIGDTDVTDDLQQALNAPETA